MIPEQQAGPSPATGAPGRTSRAEPSARAWRHGSRALVLSPAGSLPPGEWGPGAVSGAPRGAQQGCAGKAMMTLLSCGHRARGAEDRADSVPGSGGGCYVPSLERGSGAGWAEGWCCRRLGAHGRVQAGRTWGLPGGSRRSRSQPLDTAAAVWMRDQDPEERERPEPQPGTCRRRRTGRGHSRPTAGLSSSTIHSPQPRWEAEATTKRWTWATSRITPELRRPGTFPFHPRCAICP